MGISTRKIETNGRTNFLRADANTDSSVTLPLNAGLTDTTAATSSPRRVSGRPTAATSASRGSLYSPFSIEIDDYHTSMCELMMTNQVHSDLQCFHRRG